MSQWRGIAYWPHEPAPTDEQIAALRAALPDVQHDPDREILTARVTISAGTLRAAADETAKVTRAAHAGAFGEAGELVEIRVLTEERWATEQMNPPPMDLIGHIEIAEVIGVTKTRVGQLAAAHPSFPRPVGTPRAGRMYTRASIEAFARSG